MKEIEKKNNRKKQKEIKPQKQEKGYDFPTEDDSKLDLRTEMLTQLLISLDMQKSLRVITDMAFNSIDDDGSDSLDVTEI